jgi:hypothetical protein
VHTGPGAGQHFTAAIQNAGPHMAEEIRVTATLGAMPAEVVVAPHILPPHSSPEPLGLLIQFGTVTYPDILNAIRAGELLRVQVDFRDGRPTAESVVQYFVFRLEQDDAGGTDWVSHHETCPA